MRTTLDLEDRIAQDLEAEAARTGRTFENVVNEILRIGLATKAKALAAKPFRGITHDFGEARPGIRFDKALALADALEDEEILRKLEQGK